MYNELFNFREERGLQSSPGNITANITAENAELQIELSNNNVLGMICELSDHVIYSINAMEACGHDAKSNIESISNYDSELLDDPSPERAVSCILIALAGYNLEHIESISNYDSELLDDPSPERAVSCILIALAGYNIERDIKALALIARIALNAINALGFYAERCVLEKAKCINSRKGSHNAEAGKWQKDSRQCKSTLYKPDYPSCKK